VIRFKSFVCFGEIADEFLSATLTLLVHLVVFFKRFHDVHEGENLSFDIAIVIVSNVVVLFFLAFRTDALIQFKQTQLILCDFRSGREVLDFT
jgi:hypothetical protein